MPQPRPKSTPPERLRTVLVPSNAEHGPACGTERIPCPIHGLPWGGSYAPAERHVRPGGVFIFAHDCHQAWRVAA
jgi:hypothetical protein